MYQGKTRDQGNSKSRESFRYSLMSLIVFMSFGSTFLSPNTTMTATIIRRRCIVHHHHRNSRHSHFDSHDKLKISHISKSPRLMQSTCLLQRILNLLSLLPPWRFNVYARNITKPCFLKNRSWRFRDFLRFILSLAKFLPCPLLALALHDISTAAASLRISSDDLQKSSCQVISSSRFDGVS